MNGVHEWTADERERLCIFRLVHLLSVLFTRIIITKCVYLCVCPLLPSQMHDSITHNNKKRPNTDFHQNWTNARARASRVAFGVNVWPWWPQTECESTLNIRSELEYLRFACFVCLDLVNKICDWLTGWVWCVSHTRANRFVPVEWTLQHAIFLCQITQSTLPPILHSSIHLDMAWDVSLSLTHVDHIGQFDDINDN